MKTIEYSCRVAVLLLVMLFAFFSQTIDSSPQYDEYTLKAVYIKKFSNYIDWPKWKLDCKKINYFTIGIIGKTPIYDKLTALYKDEKIFNKTVQIIKIKKLKNNNKLSSFNVIFIGIKDRKRIKKIVEFSKKNSILLISDTPHYAQYGIHINFYVENKKLKFEINRGALIKSELSTSSVLLSLAKIVHTKGDMQ